MSTAQIELLARGVVVRDGRLLVCRTGNAPIVYLPGGHVEFGETARSALEREINEELGCRADAGRFLGGIQHTFVQKHRRHWEVNLIFEMRVEGLHGGGGPDAVEDHLSFAWINLSDLAAAQLEPAALCRHLPDWLAGETPQHWIEPDALIR